MWVLAQAGVTWVYPAEWCIYKKRLNGHHLITFSKTELTFLHVHVIFPHDTYSDCCPAKAQLVKMKLELRWNVSGVVNFAFKYVFLIGCSAAWLAPVRAGRQCPGIHKRNAGGWPETYSIGLLVQLVKITYGWFIITSSETWARRCWCRLDLFETGLKQLSLQLLDSQQDRTARTWWETLIVLVRAVQVSPSLRENFYSMRCNCCLALGASRGGRFSDTRLTDIIQTHIGCHFFLDVNVSIGFFPPAMNARA